MTADNVRASIECRLQWHCERAQVLLQVDCFDKAVIELDEARRLRVVLDHWPKGETHVEETSATEACAEA